MFMTFMKQGQSEYNLYFYRNRKKGMQRTCSKRSIKKEMNKINIKKPESIERERERERERIFTTLDVCVFVNICVC